ALDRAGVRAPRVPPGVLPNLMACPPSGPQVPAAAPRPRLSQQPLYSLPLAWQRHGMLPHVPTERSVVLTWRSMHLADDAVRRVLDERLAAEAGCSLLEHDLLAWLTADPQRRIQLLKLAGMLGVTRGGLTRIVDRLAERGWIDRDRPASNRRQVYAVLTP